MTAPEMERSTTRSVSDRTGQRRWHRRRDVWAVAGVFAFALLGAEIFGRRYTFFDMKIYHGAVEWWLGGGELYEFIAPNTDLGFTYPPFAALAMTPMATMSAVAAGWVNVIISIAALALVLIGLLVPMADRYGWPRWPVVIAAVPLAWAIEPSRETVGFGQVNLLLFGLVMADLVALYWRAHGAGTARGSGALARFIYSGAWAGAGIGLATAIKITPGLFIVYLLFARQWRTAAVASGTAAGASLVAWVFAPRESFAYFTSTLWETDRVGAADFTPNQSLAGVLARLYDSPETPTLLWLSFAALCCALGLIRAVSAHQEGDDLTAFTLVGLTSTVISPISWTHHLVFVIPAVVILLDAAMRRRYAHRPLPARRPAGAGWSSFVRPMPALVRGRSLAGLRYFLGAAGVYLLFLMSPIWWVRHRLPEGSHYDSGLWGVLAENSLALGVILLVALLPWRPQANAEQGFARPLIGASGASRRG